MQVKSGTKVIYSKYAGTRLSSTRTVHHRPAGRHTRRRRIRNQRRNNMAKQIKYGDEARARGQATSMRSPT